MPVPLFSGKISYVYCILFLLTLFYFIYNKFLPS